MWMSPLVVCLNNLIILTNSLVCPSVNIVSPIVNSNDRVFSTLSLLIRPRLLLGVYLRLLLFRNSWLMRLLTMLYCLLFEENSVQREISIRCLCQKGWRGKLTTELIKINGDNFAFILPGFTNGKPMSLICNEVVAVLQRVQCQWSSYVFSI